MSNTTVVIIEDHSVYLVNATREQVEHNLKQNKIRASVVEQPPIFELKEFLEAVTKKEVIK